MVPISTRMALWSKVHKDCSRILHNYCNLRVEEFGILHNYHTLHMENP
jgi:hypothetical protein